MRMTKLKSGLLIMVVALIGIRATLPYIVENKVNQVIADNPKTTGQIGDVDLWLLSGRASIQDLAIFKADAEIPTPILSAKSLVFSISWKDLLYGRLYGDIEVTEPILNIVDAQAEENTQTGAEIDWRSALVSVYPFEINRIYVEDGGVHFRNFNSEPPVDIYLESINASASNITNEIEVEDSKAASINLKAKTIGGGTVALDSTFNLLRQPARGSGSLVVSGMDLSAINDLAKAYANLDIQSGVFEMDAAVEIEEDGDSNSIDGTLKPTVTQLNVLRWQQDAEVQKDPGLILAWEGLIDGITYLLEVGKQDKMTTEIPISGTLEETDIGVSIGVLGLIKNAIVDRFDFSEPDTKSSSSTSDD